MQIRLHLQNLHSLCVVAVTLSSRPRVENRKLCKITDHRNDESYSQESRAVKKNPHQKTLNNTKKQPKQNKHTQKQ